MKNCIFNTLLLSVILFISTNAISQTVDKNSRMKGWQSDIDTLFSIIKKEHYVYKTTPLPKEMLMKAANLKTKIAEYSDEKMLGELERLMYYLGDGHSYILPISTKFQSFYMPIQFYIFSDGVFIIDADEPYKNLIGSKVLSIHHIPISKLINDMNYYVHQDNKYTVKWFAPSVLRFRGVYEYYGLKAGSSEIEIELISNTKEKKTSTVLFVPATDFRGIPKLISSKIENNIPPPLYLSDVPNNFWFKKMPEKKIIYFQFNQVQDKEDRTLKYFTNKLDSVLKMEKPAIFIIDVRHNNGGNSYLLTPLLSTIKNFELANLKSKIVVITGRNTFSAAQIFISQLARDTHAIFAGEPSASKPNFVGEDNNILLPFSGAMGSISNKYHETIAGDKRQWIEPNIPIYLSSKAYFNNQDPVLEYILKNFK